MTTSLSNCSRRDYADSKCLLSIEVYGRSSQKRPPGGMYFLSIEAYGKRYLRIEYSGFEIFQINAVQVVQWPFFETGQTMTASVGIAGPPRGATRGDSKQVLPLPTNSSKIRFLLSIFGSFMIWYYIIVCMWSLKLHCIEEKQHIIYSIMCVRPSFVNNVFYCYH